MINLFPRPRRAGQRQAAVRSATRSASNSVLVSSTAARAAGARGPASSNALLGGGLFGRRALPNVDPEFGQELAKLDLDNRPLCWPA